MLNDRITELKKLQKESPDDPFIYYALALEYQKSNADEAEIMYLHLLENFPDYLPTYYHAAHFFWEKDALDEAMKIFDNGIILAENTGDSHAQKELKNARQNLEFEL